MNGARNGYASEMRLTKPLHRHDARLRLILRELGGKESPSLHTIWRALGLLRRSWKTPDLDGRKFADARPARPPP